MTTNLNKFKVTIVSILSVVNKNSYNLKDNKLIFEIDKNLIFLLKAVQ